MTTDLVSSWWFSAFSPQPTHMADFTHIQSIHTSNSTDTASSSSSAASTDSKACLQLRVAGQSELLSVSCPSNVVAENMADLIDGYCRLVNNSNTSIWNRKGKISKYFAFNGFRD